MTEPAANPSVIPDDIEGGTVLAFLNEVAGGRKLLGRLRERVDAGAGSIALAAPQNQPVAGQIVDVGEVRDAALSRVEVTQEILDEFGIELRAPRSSTPRRRWRSTTPSAPSRPPTSSSRACPRPASASPART